MGIKCSKPTHMTSEVSESEKKVTIEEPSPEYIKEFKFASIPKEQAFDKDSAHLSIISYNILADCFCDAPHFPFCDAESLDFKERLPKIIREIKDLSADIVCLQEVDHFEDIYKQALSDLGYEVFYKKRKSRNDGCLIGLKKSRELTVLSKGFLDYDVDHKYTDNMDFVRDKLALHLKIQDKKHSKTFHVINTHFYWDARLDYVKYLQMYLLLRYMKANIKEDEPILLCGDFNSPPDTNTIRVFLTLEEPKEERCKKILPENYRFYKEIYEEYVALKSPFKWEGAYKDYKSIVAPEDGSQGFPDYTNYTESYKGTLDYIFYTPES